MNKTITRVATLITATALTLAPTAAAEPADIYNTANTLTDTDGDGIPDEWEEHGFTDEHGNEYPLNHWGVDPNKPDLFLQLNWMKPSNGYDFAPNQDELINLINIFDTHGYTLHIDAGDVYTSIPENAYTPRGGETIDYQPYYIEDELPYELYGQADEQLGDYANIFRSGVIVDNVRKNMRVSGLGLVGGKSFVASKQHTGQSTDRVLAHVLLHEFGHTLGLKHSGSSDLPSPGTYDPHYPNYHSVMNYLYMYDTLNYSEEVAVDTPELPEKCSQTYLECFTGSYYIPEDWENLQAANMGFEYTRGKTGTNVKVSVNTSFSSKKTLATEAPSGSEDKITSENTSTETTVAEKPERPSNPARNVITVTINRPEGEPANKSTTASNVSNEPDPNSAAAPTPKQKSNPHKENDSNNPALGILIGALAALSVAFTIAGIGYVLGGE